jgi:hypothetical protein
MRNRHCSAATGIVQLTPADRKGRASPNYRHFNSIYRHDRTIYVVAHNHTLRTGRPSEVWHLDLDYGLREVVPAGGSCCHNVVMHEKGPLLCRSIEGSLALDGADVLHGEGFMRGLAYDGRHVLVGSSTFARDHADRDHDDGVIDVLTADLAPSGRIIFPRSSVRDIRMLSVDRGLSNHEIPPYVEGPR